MSVRPIKLKPLVQAVSKIEGVRIRVQPAGASGRTRWVAGADGDQF
jgi:hypothetical protein